jgi:hypothetical protein
MMEIKKTHTIIEKTSETFISHLFRGMNIGSDNETNTTTIDLDKGEPDTILCQRR